MKQQAKLHSLIKQAFYNFNISFFHTWMNYAITLAGMAAFFVAEIESYDCDKHYGNERFPCSRLKWKQSKYSGFFEILYDTMVNSLTLE